MAALPVMEQPDPRAMFTLETNAKWLDSIRRYVLDADARILDLHHLDLTVEEIRSILQFLVESQVCELDLRHYSLENQMGSLCELLIKTKIKKLNVSFCKLTLEDIMSLMRILKDLQITDLDISGNKFLLRQRSECDEFMTCLGESHLTSFSLCNSVEFIIIQDVFRFIDTLCKTSITHLNLSSLNKRGKFCDAILSLFHSLKHSAITHLNLVNNKVFSDCPNIPLKFGNSLRESKLIELNLCYNRLSDDQVEGLFKALEGSQVSSLNLGWCNDHFETVFPFLKRTRITRLDIGETDIKIQTGISDSSLVSLHLNFCRFGNTDFEVLMKSLRSSKLEELYVLRKRLNDEILLEFSRYVTETALTSVSFSGHLYSRCIRMFSAVATLMGALQNSNVTSLKLRWLYLNRKAAAIAFPSLRNTQLTHLDLSSNSLGGGLLSLAEVLKFTALTRLNLKENYVNDEDAQVLAACVKETCVSFLNLGCNLITDNGAVALALSFKGSKILVLNLKNNKIKNPGLEVLASNAVGTFITSLKVSRNPGNRRIVDTVIWNNRRSVLECLRFFKQIAPEPGTTSLRFGDIVSTADVDKFLDECLNFYKILLSNQSTAVTAFSQHENFTVGQDQMNALLFEEFPRQFVQFIVTNIEAEVSELVSFLMKAEEMGLMQIVELLLLNRPMYTLDESQGILHPYVYQLLNRYKFPICNLDVEPHGIKRIEEYFTKNKGISGASEVIAMLKRLES